MQEAPVPGLTRPVVTVVVNDNSPDGTGDVADELAKREDVAHDRLATDALAMTGIVVASCIRFLMYRGAIFRRAPAIPAPSEDGAAAGAPVAVVCR